MPAEKTTPNMNGKMSIPLLVAVTPFVAWLFSPVSSLKEEKEETAKNPQEDREIVRREEEGEHEEERLEARARLRPVLEEAEGEDARISRELPLEEDEDDDESAKGHERSNDDGIAPSAVGETISESPRDEARQENLLLVATPLKRKEEAGDGGEHEE